MEIGVEYSVALGDVEAFERYMAMLKTYYMDYADKLEESPKKYELLGLNLLRLLSQNETAKFHTELELLDPSTIQENPYISCPVKLEQDIMEGSYKKVCEFSMPRALPYRKKDFRNKISLALTLICHRTLMHRERVLSLSRYDGTQLKKYALLLKLPGPKLQNNI